MTDIRKALYSMTKVSDYVNDLVTLHGVSGMMDRRRVKKLKRKITEFHGINPKHITIHQLAAYRGDHMYDVVVNGNAVMGKGR